MKTLQISSKPFLLSVMVVAVSAGCKPLIALYDSNAYAQAVSIKVDLQNLVDTSSTTEYSKATEIINQVNTEIQKAIEYEKGRENNSISAQQYELLFSDAHSYKAFLQLWESQGTISRVASGEFKTTIGKIMDKIIQLENGKNKSTS